MGKKRYKVGSLFAGIGGICIAFKQAGCEVQWANEWDKNACITYRNYFKNTRMIEEDISRITEPKELGYADIITSGFPCQAFSVAGYRQGFSDEKGRGNLFFETARFIDEIRPKAERQTNELSLAMDREPELKQAVEQLERYYEARVSKTEEKQPRLSPKIEEFLREATKRFEQN